MADDRYFDQFNISGLSLLGNLVDSFSVEPLSTYWTYITGSNRIDESERKSALMVKHLETGEYFNLLQITDDYQELLILHNCGDTVPTEYWTQDDYYTPQYNTPAASIVLTYPSGTSVYAERNLFTVIGSSQFISITSHFVKGATTYNSTGYFGFLASYSDITYKVVGGLPTDNFTFYPITLQDHFWNTGYQNFSTKFVEGSTFMLTTVQVHDWTSLINDYSTINLFPLVYFEESTETNAGRILGELKDMWGIVNIASDFEINDIIYLGDADGTSTLARVYKDGEDETKAVAIRYQ